MGHCCGIETLYPVISKVGKSWQIQREETSLDIFSINYGLETAT